MGDPLFLSLWLRGYSPLALPVYLKKALGVFPHSKLSPGAVMRVHALSFQEPPVYEEIIHGELDAADMVSRAQPLMHEDCAFQVEARWDLYRWDGEWELKPSTVLLEVYGPEFDSLRGEHVRVDFGSEDLYLPQEYSDQLKPVQSNIRSLLHLAQDLEEELTVERRLLWSEEEEDFAGRLKSMLD
ncbi:MAG: hypothetical protein HY858_13955 [Candidatus Solibacter usitatus]|nr:hypothetical protein [Candidatus Solibacter usitatus]